MSSKPLSSKQGDMFSTGSIDVNIRPLDSVDIDFTFTMPKDRQSTWSFSFKLRP